MKDYQGYFIDLDGTTYKGKEQIPAARRFIKRLQEAGKEVLFVTNNSTRTPEYVAENLRNNHDINVISENIYTTAIATADYLRTIAPSKSKIYVIGESGLRLALEKRGFILTDDQPEYVVVGLDTSVTYAKLERAVLLIRNGAKFIGTNADSNLPNERGMVPGAGSLIKLVEYATQVKPVMIGKPEAIIMEMALERVRLPKEKVIMVGDNYHTDIEAAINVGMDSLLVYTGLSRPEDVTKEKNQPTYQVNNLDEWKV
ncbi:TIGR01457 family HAD-type hydrolase [Limosilactobacillus agrestis]|uniref:Acid sugar phosphatase n=1 Tax=Limosilactobacillus agrestis TaxID=2759748 RepID=A0A7W3UHR2_9LACO|nr:TIGR01457 family HAD-type hydrolase [Limosilactobacillus agrestis]MBB1095165.1 TIGR01457 family HAD-type hydrolase [Limosilactobacillus agrestis]MBB1098947.1 TIGR01457 family HAD-type hydrolase [Limosilactobacillus agrestis]MCD7112645.1 TIGR01457 family HAD-type hydrolase [Limosilactobacillus agrestis]MCD7119249.1 TIGR01457 family HAD-type hydrolase [Limosilactobacillus agrestis]MCD7126158.1 TIGR01457 family HAD-type hydrolase [Limosilactobacillus agrestis]